MAMPAGYSSDEDELDEFDDECYKKPTSLSVKSNSKEQRESQLFLAVINGVEEEIHTLLNEGFDVNTILCDSYTLLMLAATVGNPCITKLLIDNGANVNYDRDKYTVLMAACSVPESSASPSDVFNVVQQLVDKGANVNAITRKRMTALMYACSNGNIDVVKLLLPLSEKFAADNQGWTALFWAINDNHLKIVKLLLKEGLSDGKLDIRGNTPLYYAIANDFEEIVNVLPSKPKQQLSDDYCTTASYFEDLFKNLGPHKRPEFHNQIYSILYGAKSEIVMPLFVQKNVDLKTFLALTDEQLKNIGVALPFQRYRILAALHRFHKWPYKPSSIPVVPRSAVYSNVDLSVAVVAAIRQLTAMESSIDYIMSHTEQSLKYLNEKEFETLLNNIKEKICKIKRIGKALKTLTEHWELVYPPPDLITEYSRKRKLGSFKVFFIVGAITASIFVSMKLFLK